MDGQPVWLASLSRRNPGTGVPIATGRWADAWAQRGPALLREALTGRGDVSRERLFRMNLTLCLHRALTDDEVAGLPAYFHTDPACDLAGGPVEVVWENVRGRMSTRPCVKPRRMVLDPRQPELWVPEDCGQCQPCLARSASRARRRAS